MGHNFFLYSKHQHMLNNGAPPDKISLVPSVTNSIPFFNRIIDYHSLACDIISLLEGLCVLLNGFGKSVKIKCIFFLLQSLMCG